MLAVMVDGAPLLGEAPSKVPGEALSKVLGEVCASAALIRLHPRSPMARPHERRAAPPGLVATAKGDACSGSC